MKALHVITIVTLNVLLLSCGGASGTNNGIIGDSGGSGLGAGGLLDDNWAAADNNGGLYRALLTTETAPQELEQVLVSGRFTEEGGLNGSYLEIFDTTSDTTTNLAIRGSFSEWTGRISLYDQSDNEVGTSTAELITEQQLQFGNTNSRNDIPNFNLIFTTYSENFPGTLQGLESSYNFSFSELLRGEWVSNDDTATLSIHSLQGKCNSDICGICRYAYSQSDLSIEQSDIAIFIGEELHLYLDGTLFQKGELLNETEILLDDGARLIKVQP